MAQNLESPTIRIFLASPSDVEEERDALSSLIQEINDVLAFLAPDRALRLELVRYETHTYLRPRRSRTPSRSLTVGISRRTRATPSSTRFANPCARSAPRSAPPP